MIKSIRARLTLWYVAVFSLILAVSGFAVFSQLVESRYQRLDSRLELAGRVLAASLKHEIEEHEGKEPGEVSFRSVLVSIHQLTFPAQAVTIVQGDRIVGLKPDSEARTVATDAVQQSARLTLQSNPARWSGHGWRYSALRLSLPNHGAYLFVSGESELDTEREVTTLRQSFLLGVPIAVFLSALGGYWLARKSLAPVVLISQTVESITSRNLDRRVPILNPGDELGLLAQTFNRLLERLGHAFDQQRRFMADASHELRTPVSVAHTATEVTLEKPNRTEAEYREALQIIDGQLRRLKRVVEDMFLLARADSGAVPLRLSKFYLDELLADTATAARVLGEKLSVRVELDHMAESLCHADESLLRQMVMILLDNAVKYSLPGGRVTIRLKRREDLYDIFVEDTGPGIPAEAQPLIFDRFYRADTARSRSSGTSGGAGLGLSIARWIAGMHHGELRLDATSPAGTVFCATLPASFS
ncbi:sensor histidine kinase [Paludibaculum fermentans]|uniref:histidine kinase n=1 Tax=Paludibaculum fermentans TaxID=1473598 RepID=A0A7S7NK70_PALFE|nr:ATP-binding protein [Paludibaculum fermentans]QOY85112.1 HAMP domain-containing protein [Paludibaculum fermentans]